MISDCLMMLNISIIAYINPTDGEELTNNLPNIKHCVFCYDLIKTNPAVSAKAVMMI